MVGLWSCRAILGKNEANNRHPPHEKTQSNARAARLTGPRQEGVDLPSRPLKNGTGSEPDSQKPMKNDAREVPVPVFQQAAMRRQWRC